MDKGEEYQDPDYHESSAGAQKPVQELSEEQKFEKIRKIIRREFASEIDSRENEVTVIDQRLSTARRLLHKLRYALVNNFYKQEQLQLSSGQLQDDLEALNTMQARPELATLLREGQRRIHPSVKKLLGKETVDLEEIFKCREPRNKTRKNYQTMAKPRNTTTPADSTTSLRPAPHHPEPDLQTLTPTKKPAQPTRVPRQMDPKVNNVFTIDEATRNKTKHRYRIIIGNTSKYAAGASRADRSTHKWLLYIRGPPRAPDVSRVLRAATVRLHHTYAPHHTVTLLKPPFHVSRRGWGEFPAKIELHFALPSRNRPATVEHTIKLDRNYTGLQTLGAETIVDVWLYSTPEMLEYEYTESNDELQADTQTDAHTNTLSNEDAQTVIKPEIKVPLDIVKHEPGINEMHIKEELDVLDRFNETAENDSWMNFFTKNTTEVDVDEMFIKTETNKSVANCDDNVNNCLNDGIQANIKTEVDESEVKREFDDKVLDSVLKAKDAPNAAQESKRIVKYVEPNTRKIYYLEMDRNLDLSKVQEIIMESQGEMKSAKISPMKTNGVREFRKPKKPESLLKPELNDTDRNYKRTYNHIDNDHCYFRRTDEFEEAKQADVDMEHLKSDKEHNEIDVLTTLQEAVLRLSNVRMAVDYMLKKIPIISTELNMVKFFPFVVGNEDRYWKLDFAKRRSIEWARAKLINKVLIDRFGSQEKVWRTKQILIYSRLHGHYPIRSQTIHKPTEPTEEWSSWNDLESRTTNIKEIYPKSSDITTLSMFNPSDFLPYVTTDYVDLTEDDEIDVVGTRSVDPVLPVEKDLSGLTVLPVESDEDALRFLYIEKKCADIGIELRNEDVGNGWSYSAVHAVILSAVKCFAEELIRNALAAKLSERRDLEYLPSVWVGSSSRTTVLVEHVFAGARGGGARAQAVSAHALAALPRDTSAPL